MLSPLTWQLCTRTALTRHARGLLGPRPLDLSTLVSVQLTHRSHTPTRAYQKGIVALTNARMASCATYAAIAIIAMRPFQISPSWSE